MTIQSFFASETQSASEDQDYGLRKRQRLQVNYEKGIIDQLLTPQPTRQLEFLHSRFSPGTYSKESYSHEGEQAGYVLSGSFELWVGERYFQPGIA